MKYLLLIIILFASACGTISEIKRQGIEKGAELNDLALKDAVFVTCYGASVGSIRRMYGNDSVKWQEFCKTDLKID